MQEQNFVSRSDRRLVNHQGRFRLSPQLDLPLLMLIRDRTFISRQQIEGLISDHSKSEVYRSRSRRLARLNTINQIEIHPQYFPYPGLIYSITHQGMYTLQLAGQALLSASSETDTLPPVEQTPHYLCLNEIEIAAKELFEMRAWICDRQLKSLNIASNRPTQKDYDSVAEIVHPAGSGLTLRVGIEYERTMKSKERYGQIRKSLSTESQIRGLLYFVDTETNSLLISREVYSDSLPVGVIVVSEFQNRGLATEVRFVRDRKVARLALQDYLLLL